MKKLLSFILSAVFACLSVVSVHAGEIVMGEGAKVAIAAGTNCNFTYTATKDGKLLMHSSGTVSLTWNAPLTEDSEGNMVGPLTKMVTPSLRKITISAGGSYNFDVYALDDAEVWFELYDPANPNLQISSISPQPDGALSVVDIHSPGQIALMTNFLGVYETFMMQSRSKYSSVYTFNPEKGYSNVIGIDIVEAMTELYNAGMKAGDPVKVTITGIANDEGALYHNNGTLELNYTAASRPADLVDMTFANEQVLHNYNVVGGTDGVWTFTFNSPLDGTRSMGEDTDVYGNPLVGPVLQLSATSNDDACYYYFNTHLSADGKTVTADIRGYDLGDFNGLAEYGVSFKILNLYDTDGQMALGQPSQGNVGSYGFVVDYQIYQPVTFASTWTPADGASLRDAANVSVTIDNGDRVFSVSGVTFKSGATEYTQTCTVTGDGDSKTVTCAVPEAFRNLPDVKVSLTGIVSTDGFSYEGVIAADYNAAVATGMVAFDPEDGTRVATLSEVTIVTKAAPTADFALTVNGVQCTAAPQPVYTGTEITGYTVALNPGYSVSATAGCTQVADGTEVVVALAEGSLSDGVSVNAATAVTYVIGAEILDVATPLTVAPADGDDVYVVETFTISHDAGAISLNGGLLTNVKLITPDSKTVYPKSLTKDGDTYKVTFARQTKEGEYHLTVAEGFFRVGDEDTHLISEAIDVTVNLVPMTLVTDPEVGSLIPDGDAIDWEITFDKTENIVLAVNNGPEPYVENHNEIVVELATSGKGKNIRYYFYWYNVDDEEDYTLPDGRYTFVFPAGSITINGEENDVDVRLTYIFGKDVEFDIAQTGPEKFEEGGSYANTGSGVYTFDVTAPEKAPAYIAYDLFVTDTEWIYGAAITFDPETGAWTAFNTGSKLREGKNYTFAITTFDSEDDFNNRRTSNGKAINEARCKSVKYIHFTGATPPFVYSDAALVSADPENKSVIQPSTFSHVIKVTFDAPVVVDAARSNVIMPMGGDGNSQDPVAFDRVANAAGTSAAHTEWHLTLDPAASYMTDYTDLNLMLVAYDADGKQLRGDGEGKNLEEYSHYRLEYKINNGSDLVDITVSPSSGTLETAEFVLSHDDYNLSANGDVAEKPYLQTASATHALAVTKNDDGSVTLSYDGDFDRSGDVKLCIPERCLIAEVKNGLGWKYNRGTEYTYKFTTSAIDGLVGVDSEYRVYTLQGVEVMRTTDRGRLSTLPAGMYIINGRKYIKR